MKKFLIAIILIVTVFASTACGNKQILDTVYTFDRAIISLPDGTKIEGHVEGWKEYDDSDSIQIKIDGRYYYTHLQNVVLIAE
ncbi:MAG: hypothetical protein J6D42_11685 [Clostridia bacterium]|nr:hypothetical protein [Clostridia bacterium]